MLPQVIHKSNRRASGTPLPVVRNKEVPTMLATFFSSPRCGGSQAIARRFQILSLVARLLLFNRRRTPGCDRREIAGESDRRVFTGRARSRAA